MNYFYTIIISPILASLYYTLFLRLLIFLLPEFSSSIAFLFQ